MPPSLLGICQDLNNGSIVCHCAAGWQGEHCQTQIDHCTNVTCENRAICRSLPYDYLCECLNDNYSGRFCEIKTQRLVTRQVISRSWAYVAILIMLMEALFIIILDVLKYGFGIDPIRKKIEKRRPKVSSRAPIYFRFIYVNRLEDYP